MTETVERIKTMLDIDDDLQDATIEIIVDNVTNHLALKIRRINKLIVGVPDELNFIVEEIAIRRFNRLGSEGFQSDSVEGHSITFYELEKDFVPYDEIINDYKDDDFDDGKRGRVIMI